MATVKITVRERKAIVEAGVELVCNNPTDSIEFDFDEEWSAHTTKTARFSWDGRYIDVVFDGNTVKVPEIYKTSYVFVGVFSDGITTTPAKVPTRLSIKCHGGAVVEPHPDVYAQILEKLNTGGGSGGGLPSGDTPNQMLVTDADGNTVWEDRTHYSYIANDYIIPERTFTESDKIDLTSLLGVASIGAPIREPFILEIGKTYTVNYNGTDYECVAADLNGMGALGNYGPFVGGEDTGEPFVLGSFQGIDMSGNWTNLYGAFMELVNTSSGRFSLSGEIEIVKIIPEKYLPPSAKTSPITITESNGSYTVDRPFNEAWEMSENDLLSSIVIIGNKYKHSAASVSKYDASSSLKYKIIQITYEPWQDFDEAGHQVILLSWLSYAETGSAYIGRSRDYMIYKPDHLVNKISGQGLTSGSQNEYYRGKLNVQTGEGLSIDESYNKVVLSTMSEATKGGAKVGDGLAVKDGVLSVVLKSTTSGSSKRFKLTVDDSGTLSAVEIT